MIMKNTVKSFVRIHMCELIYEYMPVNYDYKIIYEFLL